MRKKAAAVLALLIFITPVLAATEAEERTADRLNALGLFRGTEAGYELDREPNRLEGLIMLLRLLGRENEALAYTGETPFTDLPTWGGGAPARYTGYACEMGYTKGVNAEQTLFDPQAGLDARSYATFLLRALGYSDTNGDFAWSTAMDTAVSLGLTDSAAAAEMAGHFDRGNMAELSYAALRSGVKGGGGTLAERLIADGVFTAEAASAQGLLGSGKDNSGAVAHIVKTVQLPSGTVTADVITADTGRDITIRAAMVNGTLGATEPFSATVEKSGCTVAVNGNFFEAYQDFKTPIGLVMADGEVLYGQSGNRSLIVKKDGRVQIGKALLFYAVKDEATGYSWACYEKNVQSQSYYNSVMYSPAWGAALDITAEGVVTVAENGVITKSWNAQPGESVAIPANGFVMHFGGDFISTDYYRAPEPGMKVSTELMLPGAEPADLTVDDAVQIVSGAPTLVLNGEICTELDPGFTEARFTTAVTPRTAAGTLADGKLILVSTAAASIQQMRELMLELGCVNAINLDGGASTALYADGSIIRAPGRELTVTLQIFT